MSARPIFKLFFLTMLVGGIAAVPWAADNCRMTIENRGTAENPSYHFACVGTCQIGGCALDFTTDGTFTIFWCECDGSPTTTKCDAAVVTGGSPPTPPSIFCFKNGCVADCLKPTLPNPPGSNVYACTCPDVPPV